MKLNDKFHFGKFKGLRLIDVYQGTLNIDRALIKQYIKYMLTSEDRWNFEGVIGQPYFQVIDDFEVTEEKIKVIGMYSEPWNSNSNKRVKIGNIEALLQEYLSIGNKKMGRMIGGFHSLDEINKDNEVRKPVGANPAYLAWCIDEVENFFIDPSDLELMEKLKITLFKGINVVYKGNELFEYSPLTEITCFCFSDKTKEKNSFKIENNKLNLDFNEANFENSSTWSQEDLQSADWDYDHNNPAHKSSENPWIDVFGPGDEAETAYWNTQ